MSNVKDIYRDATEMLCQVVIRHTLCWIAKSDEKEMGLEISGLKKMARMSEDPVAAFGKAWKRQASNELDDMADTRLFLKMVALCLIPVTYRDTHCVM